MPAGILGRGGAWRVPRALPIKSPPGQARREQRLHIAGAGHPNTSALQQWTCGSLQWKWQKEMQQVDWASALFAMARAEEILIHAESPLLSPVAKHVRGFVQVLRDVLDQHGRAGDIAIDHEAQHNAPGVAIPVLSHEPQDAFFDVFPGKILGSSSFVLLTRLHSNRKSGSSQNYK